MSPLTRPFEDLAQSLRILLEANYRAEIEGLIHVDRAEAAGNVENAVSGVLHAFHSLFDAMSKAGMQREVDWYQTPELALMLVLRNARHPNHAKKIRTLCTHYAHEARKIGSMENYILVDFSAEEDGADTFDVFLSWGDLQALFALPSKVSNVKADTASLIQRYLESDRFAEYARNFGLDESRVVFNIVPLTTNAAIKLGPHLLGKVETRSTEADTYLKLFNGVVLPARVADHQVNSGPIAWS